jgi:hypothetical protein
MVLKVPEYLRANSLDALTAEFQISARRHQVFPNLVFLKYNQIESPLIAPIVQQCRGLILDESRDWEVVSRPFDKFFNYGEAHAASMDWNTSRVYEKLDGSLMTLYWYAGAWQIASNGTPDASGPVYGHRGTFADLFWETFHACGHSLDGPRRPNPGYCFMFEMMTPFNRVIVPHQAARVVLIGARDLKSGAEVAIENLAQHGWDAVRSFPLTSIDDCLRLCTEINPMEQEGYVVCDDKFNRVKVKSPQYVALTHMKEETTGRRMLDLIRRNESSEFLSYFPEMRPTYDAVLANYLAVIGESEKCYASIAGIADQKEFAFEALKTKVSSSLFAVRNKKASSIREFYANCPMPAMERAIEAVCGVLLPTESSAAEE